MTNNLSEFMRSTISTLTIVQCRMGDRFCAFLSNEEHAEAMATDAGGKHGDHDNLMNGLFDTDWFPVGFGDTVQQAVDDLDARVSAYSHNDENGPRIYHYLFNMLVCRAYDRENTNENYKLQPGFFPDAIPEWLRTSNKATYELIDDYVKHVYVMQDRTSSEYAWKRGGGV